MLRRPNWQYWLAFYLDECATARFRYGSLDCGLFIAGAIEVMTGIDVCPELRGGFSDRRGAFRAIKALCGEPSMEAVAAHLATRHGLPEVPVLHAQRGDVVLIGAGRNSSLGLIAMHGTEILSPGLHGTLRLRLNLATRAWRV